MHEILAQPAAGNHRTYRNILATTVPAATIRLKATSTSKSERISCLGIEFLWRERILRHLLDGTTTQFSRPLVPTFPIHTGPQAQ